jgi:hypothetical protein
MWKEARGAMDFVQNHQLVQMVPEIQLGLFQLGAILPGLEVEIDERQAVCLRALQRQRGLACLARPEQRSGRRTGQRFQKSRCLCSRYHACSYGILFL